MFTNVSNTTALTEDTGIPSSMLEIVLFSLFYIIISVTATLGNLLVMVAIYTTSNLHTTSNYFLANLALTDFLQGLISMPLRTAETILSHQVVRSLCQLSIPVSILFGSTSNINILFISIDRFVAIFFPYFYLRVVTTRVVISVVITSWIFMVAFAFAPTAGLGGLVPTGRVMICRFPVFLTKTYITTLFVIVHFIPIITVILIYGFILKASLRHARRIHVQQTPAGNHSEGCAESYTNTSTARNQDQQTNDYKNRAKQSKAARLVSYILGFFIVLVAPIVIVDVIEMLGGPKAPGQFVKVAVCMIYANHCVNCFVYAGCNRDFRKAFRNILKPIRDCVCRCLKN